MVKMIMKRKKVSKRMKMALLVRCEKSLMEKKRNHTAMKKQKVAKILTMTEMSKMKVKITVKIKVKTTYKTTYKTTIKMMVKMTKMMLKMKVKMTNMAKKEMKKTAWWKSISNQSTSIRQRMPSKLNACLKSYMLCLMRRCMMNFELNNS